MIESFADKATARLFEQENERAFPPQIRVRAYNKLRQLDFATTLFDLRFPPSNRLEPLGGKLKGFYSIRINDQWRIIFKWASDGNAKDVRICDYH